MIAVLACKRAIGRPAPGALPLVIAVAALAAPAAADRGMAAPVAPARAPSPPAALAAAHRVLVVLSDDWAQTVGQLRRFERGPRGKWLAVGDPVAVVLGKSGLGWGEGLVARPSAEGPEKAEGDGRSPAGVFALADITGYDATPPPGLTLLYRVATPALRCVDDPESPAHYNRLVDAPAAPPWRSDEPMLRRDGLYRFTVFVRHNDARAPGRGSCIFLHVWRSPTAPTVGCTAMALPVLRKILPWLDDTTLLVQLPRPIYERVQREWDLPLLPPQRK